MKKNDIVLEMIEILKDAKYEVEATYGLLLEPPEKVKKQLSKLEFLIRRAEEWLQKPQN